MKNTDGENFFIKYRKTSMLVNKFKKEMKLKIWIPFDYEKD